MRFAFTLTVLLLLTGCQPAGVVPTSETPDRQSLIPIDQAKITVENDLLPPVVHSDEYDQPMPLPYPVNTAGAEDSAFIMPDGNTLYFWFTPDPNAPLTEQIEDGVTGIWMSRKQNGQWQEPERVLLQDPGKQALDGCAFVLKDRMWFCSARTGYSGLNWFSARQNGSYWAGWQNAGFPAEYQVGELHISADGGQLYFHSDLPGGAGQYDIWICQKLNGQWQLPVNLAVVNTPEIEGWPFLSQDGNQLWFSRVYQGSPAIFRSKKLAGQWQEPELIISQFAGEPSLDNRGNLYFTHHFYRDGVALEADIYLASHALSE